MSRWQYEYVDYEDGGMPLRDRYLATARHRQIQILNNAPPDTRTGRIAEALAARLLAFLNDVPEER